MTNFLQEATRLLLDKGFGDTQVIQALGIVGHGLGVDRVYIFEDSEDPDTGERYASQRYEWSAHDVSPEIDNPEMQNMPYSLFGPGWVEGFARGEVAKGITREMDEPMRSLLTAQGILSALACPIHLQGRCWGFVGFDDCKTERSWPSYQVQTLSMLARGLGASLRHAEMKANLEQARRQLREVLAR